MEFQKLVHSRRSIRSFKEQEVEEEQITNLLAAARWAPSAGNRQPWQFIVVRKPELRKQLAAEAYGRDFLAEAPVVIVVCAVPERSAANYGKRGRELYCLQDTAAAVQNILLAAKDQGLGTCWIGAFDESVCSEILELASSLRPVAMIPVGYPDEEPTAPERRNKEEVVEYK